MRGSIVPVVACILLAGCAAPGAPTASRGGAADTSQQFQTQGPKRIAVAINGAARTFSATLDHAGQGSTPGSDEVGDLVNSGLTVLDGRGTMRPVLAEAVPALENGLWVLRPDGRMETTWRIRGDATWHDGTPLTSQDLLFTAGVVGDSEIRAFASIAFDSVDGLRAPDARTIVVTWKRPYIEAHTLFSGTRALPLPRHLLEPSYLDNKAGFLDLPYWTTGFVGTGPFRLRDWVAGSHIVVEANPAYPLGRPKLDEIEVKFVTDDSALFANILAGTVDLTMGRGLSIEQAAQLRERWTEGSMHVGALGNWVGIYPQYINPSPQAFLNLQFRRAVAHAIDRQQLADSLVAGFGVIAHSIISEREPQYLAIERRIVKYEYDPRRATQMVEALGYVKAADGVLREPAGQPLHFQVQSTVGPAPERAVFATFEFLQRLGLSLETDFIPPQARSDRARRAERTGFEIQRQTNGVQNLYRFHSNETPLRENNYVGDNRSRYQHPDLDGALDRYFTSVPRAEQMQALGDVIHHMTDQLNVIGLILDGDPIMTTNRLRSVDIPQVGKAYVTANAHEWDVAR